MLNVSRSNKLNIQTISHASQVLFQLVGEKHQENYTTIIPPSGRQTLHFGRMGRYVPTLQRRCLLENVVTSRALSYDCIHPHQNLRGKGSEPRLRDVVLGVSDLSQPQTALTGLRSDVEGPIIWAQDGRQDLFGFRYQAPKDPTKGSPPSSAVCSSCWH